MWKMKDVYYVSDSTALLTEDLGKSLLCQFPEIGFNEEKIPFIISFCRIKAWRITKIKSSRRWQQMKSR